MFESDGAYYHQRGGSSGDGHPVAAAFGRFVRGSAMAKPGRDILHAPAEGGIALKAAVYHLTQLIGKRKLGPAGRRRFRLRQFLRYRFHKRDSKRPHVACGRGARGFEFGGIIGRRPRRGNLADAPRSISGNLQHIPGAQQVGGFYSGVGHALPVQVSEGGHGRREHLARFFGRERAIKIRKHFFRVFHGHIRYRPFQNGGSPTKEPREVGMGKLGSLTPASQKNRRRNSVRGNDFQGAAAAIELGEIRRACVRAAQKPQQTYAINGLAFVLFPGYDHCCVVSYVRRGEIRLLNEN